MVPELPTQSDYAHAIDQGVRVLFGLPVLVHGRNGATHLLNMARAAQGHPDPYFSSQYRETGDLLTMYSAACAVTYMLTPDGSGVATNNDGVIAVKVADMKPPDDDKRFSPEADEQRRKAASIALGIRDVHLRYRMLTEIGGLAVLCSKDRLLDSSDDGELFSMDETQINARLLRVTCPSTTRQYVHMVPVEMATARDARSWLVGTDVANLDAET